jgi:hypothetical protein
MGLRLVLAVVWSMPLAIIAGLLYHEFMVPAAAPLETNRAMRERMCREHADLARSEPANTGARSAVLECVDAGYLTRADGISAID